MFYDFLFLRIEGVCTQLFNLSYDKYIPNWKSETESQPVIYPVCVDRWSGRECWHTLKTDLQWYYNEELIIFDVDGFSTNFRDTEGDPIFKSYTDRVCLSGENYDVPCLKIISNLVSLTNTNPDTIGIHGIYELENGDFISMHYDVCVPKTPISDSDLVAMVILDNKFLC